MMSGALDRRDGERRPVLTYKGMIFSLPPPDDERPIKRIVYPTRFAPWERITPILKVPFLTKAVAEGFPAHALTLRLGCDRIAEGEASPKGLLRHVDEQVRRNLERALGRSFATSLWLGLEFDKVRAPHLHGVIGLNPNEVETARRVLRRLCGSYCEARKVALPPISYDLGWARYSSKESSLTASVTGRSAIAVPHALTQRARVLYQRAVLHHTSCMASCGPDRAEIDRGRGSRSFGENGWS